MVVDEHGNMVCYADEIDINNMPNGWRVEQKENHTAPLPWEQ